jgi:hypothetical protein
MKKRMKEERKRKWKKGFHCCRMNNVSMEVKSMTVENLRSSKKVK